MPPTAGYNAARAKADKTAAATEPDLELIRSILHENDSRAFGELMKRYTSQVYGAAMRLTKDEDNAAEVTQLAFIQAYKRLDSWSGDTSRRR